MERHLKKIIVGFLVLGAAFFVGSGFFIWKAPDAGAQVLGTGVTPTQTVPWSFDVFQRQYIEAQRIAREATLQAKDKLEKQLNEIKLDWWAVAFKNSLGRFLNKLAADSATFIASGGKGQKPLLFTENWQDYLEDAGEAAVGDFVDALGDEVGVNLCAPPSVMLKVGLGLKIQGGYQETGPRCKFNELIKNWDVDSPEFLDKFGAKFDPSQNDFGIALNANIVTSERSNAARLKAMLERTGQVVKSTVDPISDVLQTPGDFIAQDFLQTAANQKDTAGVFTGRMAADVINTFGSTLASQLLQKIQGGLFTMRGGGGSRGGSNLTTPFGSGGAASGSLVAGKTFKKAFNNPPRSINDYNLVSDFASCPSDSSSGLPNSCVIDGSFLEALNPAGEDTYLTVREAVEKGHLHGNWPFGYKNPGAGVEPAVSEGYAYSNMIKLRRARIIPIGWEIAAQKVRESGNVYTLEQVVAAFDDPGDPNNPDPEARRINTFYHLVDPDWVLKTPKYLCRAEVPGQLLQVGTSARKDYCADMKDCVVESPDGNSCAVWGYCTREKNIWRFSSNSCQATFNSCRTLARTSDDQRENLLLNSLDKAGCNAGNAGCLWYSQARVKGQWLDQNRVYLNRFAGQCEDTDSGCQQFLALGGIADGRTIEEVVEAATSGSGETGLEAYEKYANSISAVYLNAKRVSCTYDEVGCQMFKAANGDPDISGVVTSQDQCPRECVGYNAYSQQETDLEQAKSALTDSTLNFIPATARSCSALEVGCSEFTNLDRVSAGGEAAESYSYIRQCQKPDETCANFYTWTSTEDTGLQLRNFYLAADTSGNPLTTTPDASCDLADPDCRKFFGADGRTHQVKYKKTITCSDRCFRYRLTGANEADCRFSSGQWTADGQCIYSAIPEQGIKCNAAVAGCREYRGNSGENVARLLVVDFESGSVSGFNGGVISAESVNAPGRSLKVSSKTSISVDKLAKPGRTYVLDFWMKSQGSASNTIRAAFGPDLVNTDRSLELEISTKTIVNDTDWHSYTFGPVFLGRDVLADEKVIISVTGAVYLDNVVLREIQGRHYLVKNSWKTPLSCETADRLPGGTGKSSALGCKEYLDTANKQVYLKSFSRLCGADKVGCQALVDTQNSKSPYKQTFDQGPGQVLTVSADEVAYVVNDPEKSCNGAKKGCMALGRPNITADDKVDGYETVYLVNDPDQYERSLCKSEHLFCQEYKIDETLVYYKQPGNKICEYRAIQGSVPVTYAWFRKGDNTRPNPPECACEFRRMPGSNPAKFAKYLLSDTENAHPDPEECSDSWGKSCPEEQSGCTEFHEPISRTSTYSIKDEKIDTSSCNGVVDWKKGCVLFDDRSNLALTFTSYDPAKGINTSFLRDTPPISCGPNGSTCDSNTLVKVRRDRTCGEWLACKSSAQYYDSQKNEIKSVCYGIGRCVRAKESNVTDCAEWVENPYMACQGGPNDKRQCRRDNDCGYDTANDRNYRCETSVLTEEIYKGRDVAFGGREFSGLSIVNRYPVEKYKQVVYDKDDYGKPVFGLTYLQPVYNETPGQSRTLKQCVTGANSECGSGNICVNRLCYRDRGIDGTNGASYKFCEGPLQTDGTKKSCFADSDCGKNATGNYWRCRLDSSRLPGTAFKQCRGYPESSSPFPAHLGKFEPNERDGNIVNKAPGFQNANLGQKGEDVECNYKKVTYLDGATRYYNENTEYPVEIPSRDSRFNFSSVKSEGFTGWRGYCIEEDSSRVINGNPSENGCVSWYPIDLVAGEVDIYNNHPEAGYTPEPNKRYYCAESKLMEYRQPFDIGERDGDDLFNAASYGGSAAAIGAFVYAGTAATPVGWTLAALGALNGVTENAVVDFFFGEQLKSCDEIFGASCGEPHGNYYIDDFGEDCKCFPHGVNRFETGWFEFDGFFGLELATRLRQVCTTVVRIEGEATSQKSKAWTSRLQVPYQEPHYTYTLDNTGMSQAQDQTPFGAIVPPSEVGGGIPSGNPTWSSKTGGQPVRVVPLSYVKDKDGNATLFTCPSNEACGRNGKCGGRSDGRCNLETLRCENAGKLGEVCARNEDCDLLCASAIVECGTGECGPDGLCVDGQNKGKQCSVVRAGAPMSLNSIDELKPVLENPLNPLKTILDVRNRANEAPYVKVEGFEAGKARLQQLFGKSFGVWRWRKLKQAFDEGAKEYTEEPNSSNIRLIDEGAGENVTVRQVVYDKDRKSYFEGSAGFSINQSNQIITGEEGTLIASMQFYAYNANGEQMPLREIEINWGDHPEGNVFSVGSFQNHKHYCKKISDKICIGGDKHGSLCGPNTPCTGGGRCLGYNFGDSEDACVADTPTSEGFFTFIHIYTCEPGGLGWVSDKKQCEFVPQLRIRDNWGKEITGVCSDSDLVKSACFIPYSSKIIVKP